MNLLMAIVVSFFISSSFAGEVDEPRPLDTELLQIYLDCPKAYKQLRLKVGHGSLIVHSSVIKTTEKQMDPNCKNDCQIETKNSLFVSVMNCHGSDDCQATYQQDLLVTTLSDGYTWDVTCESKISKSNSL